MSKISYIILPKHEDRRASRRVIGNAMRLLVAVLLTSALVVITLLAANMAVNDQPVQPWTLAPALVPSEPTSKPAILERKYILCQSELVAKCPPLKSHKMSDDEHLAIRDAHKVFRKCDVIRLRMDINKKKHMNPPLCSSHWNDTQSCHEMTGLPETQPTALGAVGAVGDVGNVREVGFEGPPVTAYDLTEEQIFDGTPFLSMLQDLFNSERDMLDRCVRLLLVWRFGGVVWDIDEPFDERFFRYFKAVMDSTQDGVLVEKETASVVYSARSCHAVIGSMLMDFAQLPLNRQFALHEHQKYLVQHAQELYNRSVYFIPRLLPSYPDPVTTDAWALE